MANPDRMVAGIRCREILAELSDYVDGQLSEARVKQIQAHLIECDWCERFGGEFAAVVGHFRRVLMEADPVSAEVGARLRERLVLELGRPGSDP